MSRDASGRVASRSTADLVRTFGNGMTVSEEANFRSGVMRSSHVATLRAVDRGPTLPKRYSWPADGRSHGLRMDKCSHDQKHCAGCLLRCLDEYCSPVVVRQRGDGAPLRRAGVCPAPKRCDYAQPKRVRPGRSRREISISVPLYADQQYRGGPKIPGAPRFSLSKPQNA